MEGVICFEDRYYILATKAAADDRTRVIKEGDSFAVLDRYGDIGAMGKGEQGLYHEGTRFLSRLELTLNGERPLLLSSGVDRDNVLLTVDLSNPDFCGKESGDVKRETIHLFRGKLLLSGTLYEHLRLANFNLGPFVYTVGLHFSADFADIFEVRGQRRARAGRVFPPRTEDRAVILAYEGLDEVVREARIRFEPEPGRLDLEGEEGGVQAFFTGTLAGKEQAELNLSVSCRVSDSPRRPVRLPYRQAYDSALANLRAAEAKECAVTSSSQHFDALVRRSLTDLRMMVTRTEDGSYPYAGVPWYSTPFGRDGIIAALQVLWINPEVARGALAYLASTQADAVSEENDAEPGKIIHEVRRGEMAALGEIPFRRYYGSVDSTPLFILLAAEYHRRTGDLAFIGRIWPNIERGLAWIDTYGDADGDGFVEYRRKRPTGLRNQGWKDSEDSIMHQDGRLAEGPIALCEVQAYVYAAKRGAAALAGLLGRDGDAARLAAQAEALRRRFEAVFWDEELAMYVLALDGDKRPCRVRSSNAGHCLFTGIAAPDRARRVAAALLAEDMFSGWGVRTLAGAETLYNPMSYHNGSVWPHDNSLIGLGMAMHGLSAMAGQILGGMLDASQFFDLHRLPELFCGFKRRPGEGPTSYPVACAPQTWASGAPLLLLQACTGLRIDAARQEIAFSHPMLPAFLDHVRIDGLRVGKAEVDLLIKRHGDDAGVYVTRRKGEVGIVTKK